MCCDEIREKISTMADGELSESDRAQVMEHLAACPECLAVYDAFSALSEVISDLEPEQGIPLDFVPWRAAAPAYSPPGAFPIPLPIMYR